MPLDESSFAIGKRAGVENRLPLQQRRLVDPPEPAEQEPVSQASRPEPERAGEVDDVDLSRRGDQHVLAGPQVQSAETHRCLVDGKPR